MAVIADFASYPDWVDSMKSAEVLTVAPDGRAETVRMVLDHPLVKDDYVLAYDWHADSVSWTWSAAVCSRRWTARTRCAGRRPAPT